MNIWAVLHGNFNESTFQLRVLNTFYLQLKGTQHLPAMPTNSWGPSWGPLPLSLTVVNHIQKALEEVCWTAGLLLLLRGLLLDWRPGAKIMSRSKNPLVRQQSRMFGLSASSFPLWAILRTSHRSCRPREQRDNVGQDDHAYDGKEHQDENIQHYGSP